VSRMLLPYTRVRPPVRRPACTFTTLTWHPRRGARLQAAHHVPHNTAAPSLFHPGTFAESRARSGYGSISRTLLTLSTTVAERLHAALTVPDESLAVGEAGHHQPTPLNDGMPDTSLGFHLGLPFALLSRFALVPKPCHHQRP
jgi:hypothetical protein